MRVLITGVAGFIGYHVAKKILETTNIEIFGLDNFSRYYSVKIKRARTEILKKEKLFHLIEGDILDINSIELPKFDVLIHLAAQPGVRVSKKFSQEYVRTNVIGFKKICQYCIDNEIEKVIYASSSSVYSDSDSKIFDENKTKLNPKSDYGKSKLKNEQYAQKIAIEKNLFMVGLRFFSVYGPFGRPDMAYYKFTKSLLNSKQITLNNNGQMLRDMTYIDDVVDGIVSAIKYIQIKQSIGNEIFNLGNSAPVKIAELLNIISNELGKKPRIIKSKKIVETKFTYANIQKAKLTLGFNPKVDIHQGIKKFINWYKNYE